MRHAIVLVLLALALTAFGVSPAMAQSWYTDMWGEETSSGFTIWATAVTDDMVHGVQHNVNASTSMSGPTGSQSGNSGYIDGYVSVMVSLPAPGETVGTFTTTSSHAYSCGSGGPEYSSKFLDKGASRNVYRLISEGPNSCLYAKKSPCNVSCPTPSGAADGPKQGGTCPAYAVLAVPWWKIGFKICHSSLIYDYRFATDPGECGETN